VTATTLGAPLRASLARSEALVAVGVIGILGLLVVPLPPFVLDVLLALSLGLSVIVVLVTLSATDPLEFSVFPSLLLILTLFRLGLNVSSTRLILSHGEAGRVIAAFGDAVIGGNYVVGMVIFLILVVINFMVITKGAGRVAEVAARFTLDAMPGRQMSIDADLGAGIIDEAEARRRREEIARYADFYGAMDGAAKFVRGDAVAGLIIVAINLVGGFVIGMTQRGLSAAEALTTYSTLTVGDGLVTQIPALIVSTSAGIIVTYGAGGSQIGPTILGQLGRHSGALWMTAGILGVLGMVPGMPLLPFVGLALAAAAAAALTHQRQSASQAAAAAPVSAPPTNAAPPMHDLLRVEPLELDVGYALVALVDETQGGDLLQRIALLRQQVALELGIIVPPIRIRDDIQLASTAYCIKLRGTEIARGEVLPRYLLALNTSGRAEPIEGIQIVEPSFGLPAVWIAPERSADAEALGYRVVEPRTVLATHLMEAVRRRAADLLGRQETRELVDNLKQNHPALIDDLVPGKIPLGTLHRVLQRLLKERVPIRDLVTILETLADAAEQTKDPEVLTEYARHALSKTIARLFADTDGTVRGITIGPDLETALGTLFAPRLAKGGAVPDPAALTSSLRLLSNLIDRTRRDGQPRPLITPATLRVGVRRLIEPIMPDLPVVSLGELPPDMPVESLGTWELARAA
jgi:flagellar biosynthesis protein FlhA